MLFSCGNSNPVSNTASNEEVSAFAKADSTAINTKNEKRNTNEIHSQEEPIIVGANRTTEYLPLLQNKKVGVVTNQSGLIFKTSNHSKEQSTHIVDSLLQLGINIKRVYSPEHGFRGTADAGENVKDGKDATTGLAIISLHGKNKKPTQEQLEDIDVLLFDIQDVGVRFYTYISTLTYVMYETRYSLPTRPSPNLPNDQSINLYPSLGFFEGTTINAGRGTEMQFQIFGSPKFPAEYFPFAYTPQPNFGAKNPKEKGNLCNGMDLRDQDYLARVNLEWLVEAYTAHTDKENFFKTQSFTLHAGSKKLQEQIMQGYTFKEIKKGWYADLDRFKETRKKYLIYQ